MKETNARHMIIIIFIIFFGLLLFADTKQYEENKKDCLSIGGIFIGNNRGSDTCFINGLLVKSY